MSIEELLQETLHDRATHVADDDDLGPQVIRRARGRRGRRVTVGMSAVVLVVIVVVLTITATLQRTTRIAPDPARLPFPASRRRRPLRRSPGWSPLTRWLRAYRRAQASRRARRSPSRRASRSGVRRRTSSPRPQLSRFRPP